MATSKQPGANLAPTSRQPHANLAPTSRQPCANLTPTSRQPDWRQPEGQQLNADDDHVAWHKAPPPSAAMAPLAAIDPTQNGMKLPYAHDNILD